MDPSERPHLDIPALQQALDTERAARSMTWAALSRELHISVASLREMHERGSVEADGVVLILQWLGRCCDEFVVRPGGRKAPWAGRPNLPPAPPLYARFDTIKLYEELDRARMARGASWDDVARDLGTSAGVLQRFTKGGRTNAQRMVAAAEWAGQPVEAMLQPSRPFLGPARMDARARVHPTP